MHYFNVTSRHEVCEERKVSFERADKMRAELDSMDLKLEEERKRSAELLQQVTLTSTAMLSKLFTTFRSSFISVRWHLSVALCFTDVFGHHR